MLALLVDLDGGKTTDPRFINTEQSVLPIDITLIPSVNYANGSKSVTVREKTEGTFVAEGPYGFNTTYDVYLRPCSEEMLNSIHIDISTSVANQLILT
jgi:hypothetical protein